MTKMVEENQSIPSQPIESGEQPPAFSSATPFEVAEAPPPPPPSEEEEEEIIRKPPLTLFVLIGLVILVGLAVFLLKIFRKPQSPQEANLIYWGLWEEEAVMRPIIEAFEKEHPKVKISYQKQSPQDYRERVAAAIKKGEGPDIFRFHNTWLPMLKDYLAPLPKKVISKAEFEKTFYPIVSQDLKWQEQYYGLPLEIDGLALFYNEKILKAAGFSPPTNWEEFRHQALALTVKDESGQIITAGAALGTANNIDHFADILGLIMLQNGVDLKNSNSSEGVEALTFYRLFAEPPQNTWDEALDNSILAFAEGKVAMIFAPSWEVFTIKAINPDLTFQTAPVPQLPGVNTTWASYWVEGVSNKSKFQDQAWEFLKYLTTKETMTALYTEASKTRLFGEPYSRVDLASTLLNQPYLGPFIAQAPNAQSFYLCGRTFDNGLNDRMIKYFEDAVNSLSSGNSPQTALETVSQGIQQVLKDYGLVTAPSP